jgi:hypothetical protein
MRIRRLIFTPTAVLGVLVAGLAFASLPAHAAPAEIGRFGPEGPGSGPFLESQSVAVEQATGDVYVYESAREEGNIYRFNEKGEPVNFSSLGKNAIEGVGGEVEAMQVAVDNSSGPNKGDIYIANTEAVLIYSASGEKLGVLTEEGEPCGVAVDPGGDLYVGFYGKEEVKRYAPTTEPIAEADYTSSLWEVGHVCNLAVDSAGDAYVAGYNGNGGVTKYATSQFNTTETQATGTVIDSEKTPTLAVDPLSGKAYIDNGSEIEVYTSSGAPVESFGSLSGSYGVAVNDTNGDVYAPEEKESEVIIFGPAAATPKDKLDLTETGSGSGTVACEEEGSGTAMPCGATSEWDEGTKLVVTASPAGGSELGAISGMHSAGACTALPCRFTITEDSTLITEFKVTSGGSGGQGPPGPAGPIGPTGATGPSGVGVTVVSFGPGGHECANGGIEVVSSEEVTYVCNGLNGNDGTNGGNGTNGSNGERGLTGPVGPVGSTGAQGPAGPPGKVELVTCDTIKKDKRNVKQCTAKLVSATVKFTASGTAASVMLSRHGVVYAAGTARVSHKGTSLRLRPLRRLRAGRYALTLISGTGPRERIRREVFTLR